MAESSIARLKRSENDAMRSLIEIEEAINRLTPEERRALRRHLQESPLPEAALKTANGRHSILDIATVQLGDVLQPLPGDNDLLEEMLDE